MMRDWKHPRYLLFLSVLAITILGLWRTVSAKLALIAGFDLAVLAFVLSCLPLWKSGVPEQMRQDARRDDAGQVLVLFLTSLISGVVLVTLRLMILDKAHIDAAGMGLLIVTLMAAWLFVSLIFAFHYARLYYSSRTGGDHEGLDFPGDDRPDFADFVYFAFVIGMTCQTADVNITKSAMRRVAMFHGFFAFVFNLGILALSVNVLAGSA